MCGIAGICSSKPAHITLPRIKAGTSTLRHRGPEKEGFYFNEDHSIGLGHRRLSIIDLLPEADQPMQYMNRFTIVYNGELYNYIELRKELRDHGYSFRTNSDTEVILAAFAAYGPECLLQFEGMFSFAIWDEQEKTLFAARDRFGEKPFFFFYDEEQFAFASEIKAFWKMDLSKEVNKSMLYNFLTIGYTGNPADPTETFFTTIKKLPAGSYLKYHLPENKLIIEKYWQPYINISSNISEQDALNEFTRLLKESITRRLRSDVPIGTSLSGGLDSSAVIAFCQDTPASHYAHKCFTATFEGFEKNEAAMAKKVADQFRLNHFYTSINEDEVVHLMTKVCALQDEPFSSSSPLAQYKVFEKAKQEGVTVLLDGQGADEILAGYTKYYKWYWQELYRSDKKAFAWELNEARKNGNKESFGLKNKLAAYLPNLATAVLEGKKEKLAYRNNILNRDFAFSQKRTFYYTTPPSPDLNGALYFNTYINGLEELLRLADRNSMAHSLEVRLPFLDHHLVSYLFTLPAHFKIKNGWTKWLLRKTMEKKLPTDVTWRKEKVGFEPPQQQWMRNRQVQEGIMEARKKLVAEDILSASILQQPVIAKAVHESNNDDWRIWSAASLFS